MDEVATSALRTRRTWKVHQRVKLLDIGQPPIGVACQRKIFAVAHCSVRGELVGNRDNAVAIGIRALLPHHPRHVIGNGAILVVGIAGDIAHKLGILPGEGAAPGGAIDGGVLVVAGVLAGIHNRIAAFIDPAVAGKLLGQVAQTQRHPPTRITEQLTGRETEVLRLLAQGCTNGEIATRLHLSEGTVRNHLSAIFAKLHVTDRTQAAIIAIQHGLGNGA